MSDPTRRNVLITGAAGGIGQAIATRMASTGYGIALLDTSAQLESAAATVAAYGGPCAWSRADVTNPAQIAAARDAVRTAIGPIDGLINNAGVVNHIAPLVKMRVDLWQHELEVNLTAPFLMTQAVLPSMVERRWGRIVNIASLAAHGGLYFQGGYSATKSGLLGLTRAVTLEHARHGVTCNAVLPGLIETQAVSQLPQATRDDALSLTPARRTGQPDEVAALVAFLCSDDAGFINGAEIDISGGAHLCQIVLGSAKEVAARRAAEP